MLQAVLFDMDGVIINSEGLQSKSFEQVLLKHNAQPEYNEHGIVQEVGVSAKNNWKRLKEHHNLDAKVEELNSQKQRVYEHLLRDNLEPMEGIVELLELLKRNDIKTVIASSSPVEHIQLVLQGINVHEYFDDIVSGDQVEHGKPAPDIFLAAAAKVGAEPARCIVIEDAPTGVTAANRAHIKVIAAPNEYTAKHSFDNADLVVSSLKDITLDVLQKLVS